MRWIRRVLFPLKLRIVQPVRHVFLRGRPFRYSAVQNISRINSRLMNSSEFEESASEVDFDTKSNPLEFNHQARDSLYLGSQDPVVVKLKSCRTVQELKEAHALSGRHRPQGIVQAIVCSWDLGNPTEPDRQFTEDLLVALNKIKDESSLEELSYGLLYLCKLVDNPGRLRDLTVYCLERIRTTDLLELADLSRFTVITNAVRDIPVYYTYPLLIPRIKNHLDKEELTDDELIKITASLKPFLRYLSAELMDLYREKVNVSSIDKIPSSRETNTKILKICNFLNSSSWSMKNSALIKRFMEKIDPQYLETLQDIAVAFRIVQSQLEPQLRAPIMERAIRMRREESFVHPSLLQCEVVKTLPEARAELVTAVEAYLVGNTKTLSTEDVLIVFKILRQAKVSKSRVCNIYWKKVLDKIKEDKVEQESDRLIHHCHRYMHNNNNLGGTYRYFQFERFVLDLILTELREGISNYVPSKFARLSSFLIGYGTTDTIPQWILDKLIAGHEQLSSTDCLQLCRGYQVALELRFRKGMPHDFARQMGLLENALDLAISKRLALIGDKLSITEANVIIRGLNMRRSNKKSNDIFQLLIKRLEKLDYEINSRLIRDITMNMILSRIKINPLFEKFLDYLVDQKDSISGDTVEKILHSCYSLGYETETPHHDALHCGAMIVQRDFEYMTGLAIVNSCLALSYYGALTQELMTKVFCIDFIKRLEDEIKMCYSKATYPQKVLNKVMQLNRSVCLDYPEFNVPWFQQNYVEAQTTKSSPNELFQKDILYRFKQIFTNLERIEVNHSTSYGYRVDFLLKVDGLGRIRPKDSEIFSRRLAILLLGPGSFCENDPLALCGYELLRRRHLEILGFEVMDFKYRDWVTSKLTVDHLRQQFIGRNIVVQN